jgi:hypothetical protein
MAIASLKNATLKLANTDYTAQLSSVVFTPNITTVTWTGFGAGNTLKDTNPSDWTCTVAFGQDWSEDGLSRYLYEHEGEQVEATFTPQPGSGQPTFTATVTLAPGQVGGASTEYGTATADLPVEGKPVLSAA